MVLMAPPWRCISASSLWVGVMYNMCIFNIICVIFIHKNFYIIVGCITALIFFALTHLPLVPHTNVDAQCHHWFRYWLVAFSVPTHYLTQCWVVFDSALRSKLQWNLNRNPITSIELNAFKLPSGKMAAILSRERWVKGYRTQCEWNDICPYLPVGYSLKD